MPVSDAILNAAEADDHAAFDMLTQWGSKRHQFGGNRNSGIWMIGNTLRLYERSGPGVLFTTCVRATNTPAGQIKLQRSPARSTHSRRRRPTHASTQY